MSARQHVGDVALNQRIPIKFCIVAFSLEKRHIASTGTDLDAQHWQYLSCRSLYNSLDRERETGTFARQAVDSAFQHA
jgi:hypothetical protein